MYQFSTQTIINSSLDSNGSTAKYSGSSTGLVVTRVGTFKKDNIVSIYKNPYAAGVKEVAKVRIPTVTSGKVIRLSLDVRLSQSTQSEYANSFLHFGKPVVVEIIASGTAGTDATSLVAQINGLKDRFGVSYVTAAVIDTDYVRVTATDNNQRFYNIVVSKELASYNSIIQPEYEDVTAGTFSVTTAGKVGFGDDEYMIKSIMIPTYENTRHFGINKEERPILGGNYTQYTLRYVITKDGTDGIVGGGTSITTHVFYVKSDLVTGFEAAIINAGKVIDTVGAAVTAVSITSGNLDISNVVAGADYQVTYTTTPSGVTGAVFTLNSAASTVAGTADWTKVTVTNGGSISLVTGHGLANADKIALTVEIDGYTVVKEITLQA
jgi:hypothetical protein